jgi:hypothetical protein
MVIKWWFHGSEWIYEWMELRLMARNGGLIVITIRNCDSPSAQLTYIDPEHFQFWEYIVFQTPLRTGLCELVGEMATFNILHD